MDYKKVSIEITPFQEWLREVLTAQLAEIGFDSFVDSPAGFEAYIPESNYHKGQLNEVLNEFSEDFCFDVKSETIEDQNWNEEWEKNYFKPLVVADQCVVRAPFHTEYPKLKYEIVIEPNMAFGTGNHETTSLVLESILQNDMSGKSVLDMGCGTGILGILASMKGAEKITAIDIDKWSYEGSLENARINNIHNLDVKLGDAKLLSTDTYDVIFANIQRNVLLNDLPAYNSVLNAGGTLIMSGFYKEDMSAIKTKAESLGLKDAGFKVKNNWVAYSFTK
ncbi:50S ribosomal protein L11 methyltransferase [Maribellus sp. YY47]|uniref:50S ribosomal protein L11 methyltransferase n=1 Tax=Maribellus sp. YY47 TaxID=2929486 RepID=UPI0020014E4D|nr:50S ribosomal protein L11 methyltransferase [Maribellus sp. YY47]MCK3683392.1 50S ribosomal protein L11 methyltransferase [Maribellus sp. YY47]